jgi:hypothetical protein|nr:hypothetical protein Q903MT_gene5141 [Picea sitchensis]
MFLGQWVSETRRSGWWYETIEAVVSVKQWMITLAERRAEVQWKEVLERDTYKSKRERCSSRRNAPQFRGGGIALFCRLLFVRRSLDDDAEVRSKPF